MSGNFRSLAGFAVQEARNENSAKKISIRLASASGTAVADTARAVEWDLVEKKKKQNKKNFK